MFQAKAATQTLQEQDDLLYLCRKGRESAAYDASNQIGATMSVEVG